MMKAILLGVLGYVLGAAQWLCGMRQRAPDLIATVLAGQYPDDSWPLWPWATADAHPKPAWSSQAVTTALAIEALSG